MHFLLLFLVTLFLSPVVEQQKITGSVIDAETSEPLTAVSIILKDTYQGTITNREGHFEIAVSEFPATLIFRYIGYETKEIEFSEGQKELTVELSPGVLMMDELVFTGENPAITLMERVIARKQIWRAELQSWKADSYTRQNISNNEGIVSITESFSTSWWHREKGFREVITDKRQTNNLLPDQNFAASSYLPNFYDDEIDIAGFQMIGVTHPDALRYYDFKVIERRQIPGDIIMVLEVIPKNRLQPLFIGQISILSSEYAIQNVELTPGPAVFFPPPVNNVDFKYSQSFSNYGGDFWLPVDVRIEGTFDIGFPGFRIPEIKLSQVATIREYEINIPVPDSLYKENQRLRSDTLAIKENRRFTSESERIPLSVDEQLAYQTIDSTQTLEDAFEPSGLLARFISATESSGSGSGSGSGSAGGGGGASFSFSNLRPDARINNIEGFYAALRPNYRITSSFRVEGLFGFGTGQQRLSYGTRLQYSDSGWRFFAGYFNQTQERISSLHYNRTLATASTLAGQIDYFDQYHREWFETGGSYRFGWNRLETGLAFRMEEHNPVEHFGNLNWVNEIRDERFLIEAGSMKSIEFSLSMGQQAVPFGVSGRRAMTINLEHSSNLLASDFDFTIAEILIDYRIETFLKRRFLPNTLDLRLVGFASTGTLPAQRFSGFDGSLVGLTPFGVFKTQRNRQLEGEHGIAFFWEHNFRTVPFELLGLQQLAENGLGIIVHGGHGRTWINFDEMNNPWTNEAWYQNTFRHEVGISVNNIFRFMRVDTAFRLDQPGFYVGASLARFF